MAPSNPSMHILYPAVVLGPAISSLLTARRGDITAVGLGDLYQYLAFQYVLCVPTSASSTEHLTKLTALLILLAGLVSLVVLPSYRLIALLADHVTDNMSACRHVSLHRFTLSNIDDVREEKGLPMLTSKVTRYNFVEVGKVGLAVLQMSQ